MPDTPTPTPRLELRAVTKLFLGTRALDSVSLTLLPGEVHVVAGENGAGKSTLIRVVAGAYGDYAGELLLEGKAVRFASPADAVAAGVATIHQELSLVPSLSIADNFELSRGGSAFARYERSGARDRVKRALARLSLEHEPDTLVEGLSIAERQLVEIARALDRDVRVLVMDEPTSALPEPDVLRLLALVERLKADGLGIVYISHRLNEIFRLADRVSVLRDGRLVLTRVASDLSREELVHAMLGRVEPPRPSGGASGERGVRLRVRGLEAKRPTPLFPLDFELGVGEMLGVAGVEGSGAGSLLRALFGDALGARGSLTLDGQPYVPAGPRAAFSRGVALLASDRGESVLEALSVRENGTLSEQSARSPVGILERAAEEARVAPELRRVKLKATSLAAPAGTLSGGNQQKVALVRCLLTRPRLLLLDDPTRGIDVGARADVHALLQELAAEGTSIVFRSSDLAELCALADRVLVLFGGRLVKVLERSELSETRLLALTMGSAA